MNTMTANLAPSISERELFAEFVKHGYIHCDPFTGAPSATINPMEALDAQASYLDYSDALLDWAQGLLECDDPLEEMTIAIENLGVFLQELREVRGNYSRLRDMRAHDDDGPKGYTPRPADWPGSSDFWSNITPNEASKCHVAGSMTDAA